MILGLSIGLVLMGIGYLGIQWQALNAEVIAWDDQWRISIHHAGKQQTFSAHKAVTGGVA